MSPIQPRARARRFAVTDSGIGMDAETMARLCEPFVQGDSRTSRRYGGSGLGLAICRRLAELMHGELQLYSVPGQGTTATLLMPLQTVAPAAGARPFNPNETQPVARIPSRAPSVEFALAPVSSCSWPTIIRPTAGLLVRQLAWLGYAAEAAAKARKRWPVTTSALPAALLWARRHRLPDARHGRLRVERAHPRGGRRLRSPRPSSRSLRTRCRKQPTSVARRDGRRVDQTHRADELKPGSKPGCLRRTETSRTAAGDGVETGIDASLAEEFCLAHEEDLALLRQGLRAREHDSVARAGHRIKGAARMYGDEGLAESGAMLEQIARSGAAWEAGGARRRDVEVATALLYARAGWHANRRSA